MRGLLTSLITLLAVTNLEAQSQAPKLVVFISVDQLRADYVEHFQSHFGTQGFKRLLKNGLTYRNVHYNIDQLDKTNATSILFTGCYPYLSGITSNQVYNFKHNREENILIDPDFIGNYSKLRLSPRKLLASTIGDELKIASQGRSDVYAIAPDAQTAILSAGHAANGAFWMEDENGKWATTTYYKGIPWYVDRYNNGNEALSARIDEMEWTPTLPISAYNAFPYRLDERPFKHTFKSNTTECYPKFKRSPFINKEVNRLAFQFLKYAGFGKRSCPDFLALTYYAGTYKDDQNSQYSTEIEDTYIQLDHSIAALLDTINKQVGLDKTLVVLTGTGYFDTIEDYSEGLKCVRGEFHPDRCVALLNMYLMAQYGHDKKWVKGYHDYQIFLNHKTIEEAKLDLEKIEAEAADFVADFSGIRQVMTRQSLRDGAWNESNAKIRAATYVRDCGDLIISLSPGWKLQKDEKPKPILTRGNSIMTPFIMMGPGIVPQTIGREIDAKEIAPSITYILRIRPPNTASSLPLPEVATLQMTQNKK